MIQLGAVCKGSQGHEAGCATEWVMAEWGWAQCMMMAVGTFLVSVWRLVWCLLAAVHLVLGGVHMQL